MAPLFVAMLELLRNCGVNWGSVADYLLVAGSFLAAGFAFGAFRTQRRQLHLLEEDNRRRWAAKVSAWPTSFDPAGEDWGKAQVELHSSCDEPIVDVVATVAVDGFEPKRYVKPLLPPDDKERRFEVKLMSRTPISTARRKRLNARRVTVDLEFTDPAGRRWRRYGKTGRLEELPGEHKVGDALIEVESRVTAGGARDADGDN